MDRGLSVGGAISLVALATLAFAPYAHSLLPGHNPHECAWCQVLATGGILLAAVFVPAQVLLCCVAAPAPVVVRAARCIPATRHPRAPPQ